MGTFNGMNKPPYPILCECCKLPTAFTFEKTQLDTKLYCFDCTNAMMAIIDEYAPDNDIYNSQNVSKHINAIWKKDIDTQSAIATFISSTYWKTIIK